VANAALYFGADSAFSSSVTSSTLSTTGIRRGCGTTVSRRCIGRPANEGCECPNVADIIAARVLIETALAHVFDHARPQRADGLR
jgi:hypothetical protein